MNSRQRQRHRLVEAAAILASGFQAPINDTPRTEETSMTDTDISARARAYAAHFPLRESSRDWIACADEIDRLRAEVEALKVDAERYRVLRSVWFDFGVMNNINAEPGRTIYRINMAGDLETLDAAIDAEQLSLRMRVRQHAAE